LLIECDKPYWQVWTSIVHSCLVEQVHAGTSENDFASLKGLARKFLKVWLQTNTCYRYRICEILVAIKEGIFPGDAYLNKANLDSYLLKPNHFSSANYKFSHTHTNAKPENLKKMIKRRKSLLYYPMIFYQLEIVFLPCANISCSYKSIVNNDRNMYLYSARIKRKCSRRFTNYKNHILLNIVFTTNVEDGQYI